MKRKIKKSTKLICPIMIGNKNMKGRRIKEPSDPMFALTQDSRVGVTDGVSVRKLTPIERERLQGFPDDWTKYGKGGEQISNTQRYKCCGNAVTTTVVTHIINEMFGKKK